MKPKHTFAKAERLISKKIIDRLFSKGEACFAFPYRAVFLVSDETGEMDFPFPCQVMFSVSKKKFRQAVLRNRVKRLMREAYRKNKHELYAALENSGSRLALAIVFSGKEIPDSRVTEKKIKQLLQRLVQELSTNTNDIKNPPG